MIAVESIGINVSGLRTLQCVKDVKQQIAVSRVRTLRYLFGAQIVRKSWTYKQNAHMKVCTSSDVAGRSLIVHNVSDPNFKRGPPKGYIHAIEQRWHQVECILATIMASPKAHDIVVELRNDPMARTILDRVESGPYVRIMHTHFSTAFLIYHREGLGVRPTSREPSETDCIIRS